MALNKEKAKESFVRNVITVVSSDVIKITEDKLENVLNRNIGKIKKSKDVVASLGLCISLYSLVFQAELNSIGGFSGETIKGFFLLLLLFSVMYFFYTLLNLIFFRITANDIIEEIKSYGQEKKMKTWERILLKIKSVF